MSTTSQAGPRPARNTHQASSKHHVTDQRFALLLEEDFGIPAATVLDALENEPQKQAISICEWASRTDDPAYALRCWARRHGRGAYRVPSAARDGIRERQDERRRGTAPPRPGTVTPGGLDPARIRTNIARMGS